MTSLLVVAKVTLVLLLALLAIEVMRKASAASRHLVIALGLGASVLVPALAWMVPAWEVVPRFSAGVRTEATASGDERGAPFEGGRQATAPVPPAKKRFASTEREPGGTAPGERGGLASVAAFSAASLLPLWAAGTCLFLLVLGIRALAMTRELGRASRVDDPAWRTLADELGARLGIRRPVELRRSSRDTMPLVWGVLRPAILLPRESAVWPDDRRRAVLAHELAHVARRDVAVQLLAHVACALHWFNPLAWALARRLNVERELACDGLVVRQGVDPATYAKVLVAIASAYGRSRSLAPVMAARSQLEGRIMNILDSTRHRAGASRLVRSATVALTLVALIPLASLAWVGGPVGSDGPTRLALDGPPPRYADSDTRRFRQELDRLGLALGDTDRLIAALRSESATTRAASAWALGRMGSRRAVEPLIGTLGDESALAREWAARALGEIGDPRAGDPLIELLTDDEAEVRQWAARALAELGHEPAVMPLIYALDDGDDEARQWMVRALGELRDPRAVEPLIARIHDPDDEVRQWMVRALGELRDARATQPLVQMMSDADPEVREWAARALSDIGRPRDPEREWHGRRPGYVEPLMPGLDDAPPVPGDPVAIAALIESLSSEERSAREWGARALGDVGDASAVDPLIELLADRDPQIREWAIRSLGELRDRRAVEPLIDSLGDERPAVREWSVRSLGVLRDPRAYSPLLDALGDASGEVREWAVRALGAWGDPRALGALELRLDDPDADVRRWAGRAIEHLRSL